MSIVCASAFLWQTLLALAQEARPLEGHDGPVNSLTLSPDGKSVFVGGAGTRGPLILWNGDTGKIRHRWESGGPVYSLACSPDGALMAVASHVHAPWISPPTGRP